MNEQPLTDQQYFPPVLNDVKIVCIQDIDNNIYGPFSKNEISDYLKQGRLDENTNVNFRVGKDKQGRDVYHGWMKFGKSKWKDLLICPKWEVFSSHQPPQIKQVCEVNITSNGNSKDIRLPVLSRRFHEETHISTNRNFYFIDDGDNTHGPFFGSAISSLIEQELLNLNSLVYVENGKFEWLPLNAFTW